MNTVWVVSQGSNVLAVFTACYFAERSFRLSYSGRQGLITRDVTADRRVVEMSFKD